MINGPKMMRIIEIKPAGAIMYLTHHVSTPKGFLLSISV
jgi:hypothetical protein